MIKFLKSRSRGIMVWFKVVFINALRAGLQNHFYFNKLENVIENVLKKKK